MARTSPVGSSSRVRVLHLDDNLSDAELIQCRLKQDEPRNWEFVHVMDGAQFERALADNDFDLIISDNGIPGYTGRDALRLAHQRHPDVPVIIVSGTVSEDEAEECLRKGATDVVPKRRLQRLSLAASRALKLSADARSRAAAERGMREISQRFQELAENSADVFWFMALDPPHVLYLSPAVERVWAVPARAFQADPEAWRRSIHPDDRERVRAAYGRWMKSPEKRFELDYRIVRPDGEERWIHDAAMKIQDGAGRTVRLSGVARDITDRIGTEQELRLLNSALEHRVAERTAELREANRELEAFSYSVSHDLRSPLRAISGFNAILKSELGAALGERGLYLLERVRRNCERMDELIDSLLALSRISQGEAERRPVDLTALARESLAVVQERDPQRPIELRVHEGMRTWGDERLLRIALDNLIGNAWKFSSKKERAQIEIGESAPTPGFRTFFVRDNGAGFDPRYLERLFGAFQRLHAASEFEGTGIGLATVRRIFHRHRGTVWAEGAVGLGATFFFSLPERAGER